MDAPQTNPTVNSRHKSHTGAWVILTIIITLIVAGGGVYAWQSMLGQEKDSEVQRLSDKINNLSGQVQDLDQKNKELIKAQEAVEAENDLSDWSDYTNTELAYSFKIPAGWISEDDLQSNDDLGIVSSTFLKPNSSWADGLWGIWVYDQSKSSKQDVIDRLGEQFDDKQVTVEQVTFNNIDATKVVVTTPSQADWYLVAVVFEKDNKVFSISNGAVRIDGFDKFYKTFKFTN